MASAGRYIPPHLRNRDAAAASASQSTTRTPWSASSTATPNAFPPRLSPGQPTRNGPPANSSRFSSSTSLHVFGDSFTGPLKLLSNENARVSSFKGSSAKGLNNPNSVKQVSKELLPLINGFLAPPAYAYSSSATRYALLIFGNVDIQINYLYQLQHRPITPQTFTSAPTGSEIHTAAPDEHGHTLDDSNVLANATETSLKGPALGPELFVDAVIKAYTSFLKREIVDGPVGARLRGEDVDPSKRKTAGKVLVAGVLPPLIEDKTLPIIPIKYVERLEEDLAKTQRQLVRDDKWDRISKTPWARKDKTDPIDVSTLTLDDKPPTPKSSTSSVLSSVFDTPPNSASSVSTDFTSVSGQSPKASNKTSVEDLLAHDPPLCTLPVRIAMSQRYNSLLKAFCDKYPDVLAFVDITPEIIKNNDPAYKQEFTGQADRSTWACPIDPSNVHPLWEPTLPLWLAELKKLGVPTETFKLSQDAEDSLKAYEEDKQRRMHNDGRIKLRDE